MSLKKMNNSTIYDTFQSLTSPLLADACLRLDIPLRIAPTGIRAVIGDRKIAGRVLPSQHFGSVDIFLEVLAKAEHGDILVIDNEGRTDEACIGDLVTLEAQVRQTAGMVIWGLHRDSTELNEIGLPVYSYGAYPSGPVRLNPRSADALQKAMFGAHAITREDVVFADSDGAIFVPLAQVDAALKTAQVIHQRERQQSEQMRGGRPLYEQVRYADYLAAQQKDPMYTFRKHLRRLSGEIEE
jgi:4-hydroxy-4-methyl-2-oxoglutarate aldolase